MPRRLRAAMWLTACTMPCSTLIVLADRNQQRQRHPNIKRAGKQAAPRDRARQSPRGIANFVAHDRGEFQTDQAETDHAEGIQNEARDRRECENRRR